MPRVKLSDVEYLALEGGGGKGSAYLGALKLLSDRTLKDNDPPLLPLGPDSRLKGIAGASTGAITAYMLAIGMTVQEIQDEVGGSVDYDPTADEPIRAGATPVFDIFFETPQPGLAKGVYYDQDSKRNVSAYAVDQATATNTDALGDNRVFVRNVVTPVRSANFVDRYGDALRLGRINQVKFRKAYSLLDRLYLFARTYLDEDDIQRLGDIGLEEILKKKELWRDSMYCLLYDRGLLSGNAVRQYLRYLTKRYFKPGGKSIEAGDPLSLTFRDLYARSDKKLCIAGTNTGNRLSLLFSVDETPDFPVIDAVGLSMSIPGLFKPTFVAAEVKLDGGDEDERKAHNYKYKGHFVDGGMLVNIPLHAFDREADNPMRAMLHPRILGVGLADGIDRNEFAGFQNKDPRYHEFRKELKKKAKLKGQSDIEDELKRRDAAVDKYLSMNDRLRNMLPNMAAGGERRSFELEPGEYDYTIRVRARRFAAWSVVWDFAARQLFGTLLDYSPESGQFRTPEEHDQYVPLDAYDITLTTFTPDKNLAMFVQLRAFNKMYWYFFNSAPPLELLQTHFPDYPVDDKLKLPNYSGVRSPTND